MRSLCATVGVGALLAIVSIASCTQSRIGDYRATEDEAGTPGSFQTSDASAADAETGALSYCPATTCPAPFATCQGSRFPCDVNLLTDRANCGSCGFACPTTISGAQFDCVDSACVMHCKRGPTWTLDCNGIVDDACEALLGTDQNCNGCGDACPDPAKACVFDSITGKGQCGCPEGLIACDGKCVDPLSSDKNCAGCGNACDPKNGGAPVYPHSYYGCGNGECGQVKCSQFYADCDLDPVNGCESFLLSLTSCGACGTVCDPGQKCLPNDANGGQLGCLCAPGKTLCGTHCADIATDPDNCGGCGINCKVAGGAAGFCVDGACTLSCGSGTGDCNGNPLDGCETNLMSDPRNCGSCGASCDGPSGQPCIGGRCAVEPCGGGTAR